LRGWPVQAVPERSQESPITSVADHILAGAASRRLHDANRAGMSATMPNVTIAAALAAGMLSFLSPCVLPLVPPYLVYLTGASLERFADAEPEPRVGRETIAAALLFVLGFSTVFVALGAAATWIGQVQYWLLEGMAVLEEITGLPLPTNFNPLAVLAGAVIIFMGLHFIGVFQIPLLMREKRFEVAKPVGLWGAYLMGLAFAFGWTPCIGPILAAILAVAASEDTVSRGAGMLAVYSLGLGIPFIAAAFAIEPFAAFLARFRAYLGLVEKAMGGLLIITGIAFLTGAVTNVSFWLLDTFPMLGKIG
jgi:cytochrome c-type biogenesis protein